MTWKPAISSPSATRVADPHRAAVPCVAVHQQVHLAVRGRQRREALAPVAEAAAALGVLDLGGVAQHRHAERRRGAAVVGVAVAEHDPAEPAELSPRRWQPRGSSSVPRRRTSSRRLRPRSGRRCSAPAGPGPPRRPPRPAPASPPARRADELRTGVERAGHAAFRERALRGHHPDLARERAGRR